MVRAHMKWMAALLSAELLLWPAHAAAQPGNQKPSSPLAAAPPRARMPTTDINGQKCVELAAWARTKALHLCWDPKTKAVDLTNRWTHVRGAFGSRHIEINGVKTWLSVPIIQKSQALYISALDMQALLDPILVPARTQQGQRVRVIALDPGHGGKDPGFVVGRRQEKTLTLLWAKRLKTHLEKAGFKVVLTRSRDAYLGFEERLTVARRARADVLLSLHYNAAGLSGAGARGVETYCVTPAGAMSTNAQPEEPGSTKAVLGNLQNAHNVLLAYQVHKSMVSRLSVEDRGVRRARFALLRSAGMPAALIEGGFLSTPDEAQRIASAKHRDELAKAVAEGVIAYKRLVER